MRILSDKAKQRYIETSGIDCPFCGSNYFDTSRVEIADGGASQDVQCKDCGASWTDLYTLTEIINVELPDKNL